MKRNYFVILFIVVTMLACRTEPSREVQLVKLTWDLNFEPSTICGVLLRNNMAINVNNCIHLKRGDSVSYQIINQLESALFIETSNKFVSIASVSQQAIDEDFGVHFGGGRSKIIIGGSWAYTYRLLEGIGDNPQKSDSIGIDGCQIINGNIEMGQCYESLRLGIPADVTLRIYLSGFIKDTGSRFLCSETKMVRLVVDQ